MVVGRLMSPSSHVLTNFDRSATVIVLKIIDLRRWMSELPVVRHRSRPAGSRRSRAPRRTRRERDRRRARERPRVRRLRVGARAPVLGMAGTHRRRRPPPARAHGVDGTGERLSDRRGVGSRLPGTARGCSGRAGSATRRPSPASPGRVGQGRRRGTQEPALRGAHRRWGRGAKPASSPARSSTPAAPGMFRTLRGRMASGARRGRGIGPDLVPHPADVSSSRAGMWSSWAPGIPRRTPCCA